MCHNKHQRFEGQEYREPHRHSGFWGMPFLPFLIVSLFFFVPHMWGFAAHVWGWIIPLAIGSFFFAKFAGAGALSRPGLKTKEEPSLQQPYQQVYYQAPGREMYQEGGKQFSYPDQHAPAQRSLYEEPNAQYPQNTPPIE